MKKLECEKCGKKFNSEDALAQHAHAVHMPEKEKKFEIKRMHVYSAVALLAVLAVAYLVYSSVVSPGQYDAFAKCLTEKGYVMAGTDWCSSCKNQKGLFGKSFSYVNYTNCDFNQAWCSSKGIKSYPTWVFPDGSKQTGVQQLNLLSYSSGCTLE